MIPQIMVTDVWVDDLRPGDHVEVDGGRIWARVLRLDPAFNPCFRPVVLDIDPHYAIDIDRDSVVRTARVPPSCTLGSDSGS